MNNQRVREYEIVYSVDRRNIISRDEYVSKGYPEGYEQAALLVVKNPKTGKITSRDQVIMPEWWVSADEEAEVAIMKRTK